MQSINNHILKTGCPIDMKQATLEREFHKLLFYAKMLSSTCFCQSTSQVSMYSISVGSFFAQGSLYTYHITLPGF